MHNQSTLSSIIWNIELSAGCQTIFADISWFDQIIAMYGMICACGIADVHCNPLTASGEKHVYLWGFLVSEYSSKDFEYVWTDTGDQDRQGWIRFLEKFNGYRNSLPNLVLVH